MSVPFRSIPGSRVLALAGLTTLLLAGCPDPHPPTLSNPRMMSPLTAQGWPAAPQADFADDGGDVSGASLELRDDSGAEVLALTGSITGAGGAKSGWIDFSFGTEGLATGHYVVEIRLWDAEGSRSNPVTTDFHLVAGFWSATSSPSAGFATSGIALGDLDGDGRLDVAAIESGGTHVAAWRQTTAGALAAPQSVDGGVLPSAVATGDVDADGRAEILIAGSLATAPTGEQGRLVVVGVDPLTGIPSVEGTRLLGDDAAGRIGVADLDGDGDRDVLVARGGTIGARLVKLLQAGGGLGEAAVFEGVLPVAGGDFALGDVDGDGAADLAVATGNSEVSVLRRTGVGGSFGTPEPYAVGGAASQLQAGDVDGDGLGDLVIVTGSAIQLLFGDSSGAMTGGSAGWSYVGGIFADMDGDGTLDLVMPDGGGLSMVCSHEAYFFQWGFMGLASSGLPFEAIPRLQIAAGDVTGDGARDVIAARSDGSLMVFPHR